MNKFDSDLEKEIFNKLVGKETKFTVGGFEFEEHRFQKALTDRNCTPKQREKECRRYAKQLVKIIED